MRRGLLLVLLAAAAGAALYGVESWSWDLWWHLATGRWIAEHRAIPEVDPFSFTARGRPWHYLTWLADLGLFGAQQAWGMAGIGVFKIACVFSALALLGGALLTLGGAPGVSASLAFLVGFILQPRYAMGRPEVLALVLIAAAIGLAARWWTDPKSRALLGLAPLGLIWPAIHPSAITAPLIALGALLAGLFARRPRRALQLAVLSLALSSAALLATRMGRESLGLIAGAGALGSLVETLTAEWAQPSLSHQETWLPWALIVAGLLANLRHARVRALPLALGALGTVFALRFERHLYPALMLSAPALALAATDLAGKWIAPFVLSPLIVLILPAIQVALEPPWNVRWQYGLGVHQELLPDDTLEVLRRLPPGRVMNDYQLGGYLIWSGVEPYWDGRNVSLYDDALLRELYLPARESEAGLDAVAERLDITYGLGSLDSALGPRMMVSGAWIPVFHGRATSLYVRREKRALVEGAGVPLFPDLRWSGDTLSSEAWYQAVLARPNGKQRLQSQIVLARSLSPQSRVVDAIFHHLLRQHPEVFATP